MKNGCEGSRQESHLILKNHYEWCKKNGYDIKWYNKKKGQHIAGSRTNDRKGQKRNRMAGYP